MKKFLKSCFIRLVSLFVRDDGPRVIYYHDVGLNYTAMGTPFELFRRHVVTIKSEGFAFVPFVGAPSGKRMVCLCFDDGFHGIWDCQDYLIEQGLQPTVFIAVELVGKPGYLNWDEIHALETKGFSFQSHTWSHRPLTEVSSHELPHEMADARRVLSEKLGKPVDMLCFPCGYFSRQVLEQARKAGYRLLVTSLPCIPRGLSAYADGLVPRCLVQSASPMELKGVLHGGMNFMAHRYLRQHWRVG